MTSTSQGLVLYSFYDSLNLSISKSTRSVFKTFCTFLNCQCESSCAAVTVSILSLECEIKLHVTSAVPHSLFVAFSRSGASAN